MYVLGLTRHCRLEWSDRLTRSKVFTRYVGEGPSKSKQTRYRPGSEARQGTNSNTIDSNKFDIYVQKNVTTKYIVLFLSNRLTYLGSYYVEAIAVRWRPSRLVTNLNYILFL